jgi:hypothetical protein
VAVDGLQAITASPDGKSAYAASFDSNAVAILDRDPATGALTQKDGTAGCISEDGTAGACRDGVALDSLQSVTASPDGKNVYVASFDSGAVAIFDRNDGIGPTTTIDPGPSGATNDDSPSFTFSANEAGSTFECKLDAETYSACTPPKSYSNLAEGPHTFARMHNPGIAPVQARQRLLRIGFVCRGAIIPSDETDGCDRTAGTGGSARPLPARHRGGRRIEADLPWA